MSDPGYRELTSGDWRVGDEYQWQHGGPWLTVYSRDLHPGVPNHIAIWLLERGGRRARRKLSTRPTPTWIPCSERKPTASDLPVIYRYPNGASGIVEELNPNWAWLVSPLAVMWHHYDIPPLPKPKTQDQLDTEAFNATSPDYDLATWRAAISWERARVAKGAT